jgi:8-oxo-dGTP diphosphatase
MLNLQVIDVAVCVVQSPDGRVLLAERTARQVSAGFWEMPGGKIEPGETAMQAAGRELQEEAGIRPVGLIPWISYEHQFPTRRLRLHFFRMRGWDGTPHGREGQRLAWVDPHAPHAGPILPSNDRALFALGLPQAYLVADCHPRQCPDAFLQRLHGALSGGARLVRVRMAAAAPGQTAAFLARVAALAGRFEGSCILTGSAMASRRAGLAGVHSCTRELRRLTARPPVRVWAATCHDEADLARAVSLGADFVVVSPVLPDPERPHQTPHGWDGLRRLTATCPVAVYAQGGIAPADAQAALQAGAAGLVTTWPAPRPAVQQHSSMQHYGRTQNARRSGEMFT